MEGLLRRDGEVRHLTPQQGDLLAFLVASEGRMISREEFYGHLWRGVFVEEGGLTRCISELRSVLDDDACHPSYIRTVPKRGYRWIAPVDRRPRQRTENRR